MTPLGTRILRRIRQEFTDLTAAHAVMWDNLGRLDPDASPYLHWEPTAYGWQLYGSLAPPEGSERAEPGTGPGCCGPD